MRAILSVSDKTGLVDLGKKLKRRGIEMVSTRGTFLVLEDAGLMPNKVETITGFPEMMGGRVKTLHPAVHGGILARRDHPDDLEALRQHGIGLCDIVVVNLYPFAKVAADPAKSFDDLIENIDIGGPSLVRAAAKNFRDVFVVVDPADYSRLLDALDRPQQESLAFRFELAKKAIAHTAEYDRVISATLDEIKLEDGEFVRPQPSQSVFPQIWRPRLAKVRDLRYGENPHQPGAWYADESGRGFGAATVHQGKGLSFTNLLDLDAAARIVAEFEEPAAVVIKHTNPCGVAIADRIADAYIRARNIDRVSAYGGIVGLNRPIDASIARQLTASFIEAVISPGIAKGDEEHVLSILATKPGLRVLSVSFDGLDNQWDSRTILGGALVEVRDRVIEAHQPWPCAGLRVVTKREPTVVEWTALRFAWRVCAHVKSNAVVLTSTDESIGIGGGQPNRVGSANIAASLFHTRHHTQMGSWVCVGASDAFFPFRDGLDVLADARVTAVVQPGGSKNDAEVIDAADGHGMAMVFTGKRHFRH